MLFDSCFFCFLSLWWSTHVLDFLSLFPHLIKMGISTRAIMDQNSQACIAPGKEKSFQKHSGYATLKYYDIGWKGNQVAFCHLGSEILKIKLEFEVFLSSSTYNLWNQNHIESKRISSSQACFPVYE